MAALRFKVINCDEQLYRCDIPIAALPIRVADEKITSLFVVGYYKL